MKADKKHLYQSGTCALCRNPGVLQDSHILPEMCYAPTYTTIGTDRRAIQVSGDNARHKKKFIRKGVRHYLLCGKCEKFLNEEYETPFAEGWMSGRLIPQPFPGKVFSIRCGDYRSFKLFHLSVLWRAGVAALKYGENALWKQVYLGNHELRLREMILSGDPGPEQEYPLMGFFVVDPADEQRWMPALIQEPIPRRIFGMNGYSIVFGGFHWQYICSGHFNESARAIILRENGRMITSVVSIGDDENILEVVGEDIRRNGLRGGRNTK